MSGWVTLKGGRMVGVSHSVSFRCDHPKRDNFWIIRPCKRLNCRTTYILSIPAKSWGFTLYIHKVVKIAYIACCCCCCCCCCYYLAASLFPYHVSLTRLRTKASKGHGGEFVLAHNYALYLNNLLLQPNGFSFCFHKTTKDLMYF